MIVFDDTDRWLSNENAQLVTNFFAEGVRWLLELPAALVVAVHPHYFEVTSQAELLCYLDTRINIPDWSRQLLSMQSCGGGSTGLSALRIRT